MILLTGGAGYIGSHISVALLEAGLDVVVIDNLSNSNKASLERVQAICGRSLVFRHADICNEEAIYETLSAYDVTAVIHLAGLKAVGESNVQPMTYYENNVMGTMRLVSAMKRASVKTLVFSSSATVYGIPTYLPLDEKHPLGPTNPYGRTKLFIEEMLRDLYRSDAGCALVSCGTSIRLARTKVGSSEKTRWAFRTICCHLWRKWRLESVRKY